MTTQANLQAGAIFAEDYRVVRPLGHGGMGTVYVAEQLSTGKLRALKLMLPQLVSDPNLRRRFEQEARVGARIESDHVVDVVGAGVDAATETPWLAMELLHGEDLASVVQRRGALPQEEVRAILRQLCHAIGAAHDAGIVHRDLKPENIFLAQSKRAEAQTLVKVLDFGIAKLVADARTTATAAIGSPTWMAPEQTARGAVIGPATDVWAIGLITFNLLTGHYYWRSAEDDASTLANLLREVVLDPMPLASERAAEVGARLPSGFDAWFAQTVNREASFRFVTARALHTAFERLFSAAPLAATLQEGPPPQYGPGQTLRGDTKAYVPPVTSAAGYQQPVTGVLGYQQPVTGVPGYQQPVTGVPGYQQPVTGVPGYTQPGSPVHAPPVNAVPGYAPAPAVAPGYARLTPTTTSGITSPTRARAPRAALFAIAGIGVLIFGSLAFAWSRHRSNSASAVNATPSALASALPAAAQPSAATSASTAFAPEASPLGSSAPTTSASAGRAFASKQTSSHTAATAAPSTAPSTKAHPTTGPEAAPSAEREPQPPPVTQPEAPKPVEPPIPEPPARPSPPVAAPVSNPAFLHISTLPSAQCYIDGRFAGTTPLHVSVSPGSHTLRFVNAARGVERSMGVSVEAGQTRTVFRRLQITEEREREFGRPRQPY